MEHDGEKGCMTKLMGTKQIKVIEYTISLVNPKNRQWMPTIIDNLRSCNNVWAELREYSSKSATIVLIYAGWNGEKSYAESYIEKRLAFDTRIIRKG